MYGDKLVEDKDIEMLTKLKFEIAKSNFEVFNFLTVCCLSCRASKSRITGFEKKIVNIMLRKSMNKFRKFKFLFRILMMRF